jgi:N-acetylmuramoyl-L-alanine amidase
MEVLMWITVKFWRWGKPKNVIFLLLLLKICFIFGQDLHSKKVIVIDPGHGGKDTGAIGVNGILEKVVVLQVANEILILNKMLFDNKMDIYLTRYKDTLISLSDRILLAKTLKADVFVSLHCNASSTSSKGMDVYVHNANTYKENLKSSIALGLSILEESTLKLGFKKRGIQFTNFQVLRENTSSRPTTLIEMGFVTNIDEADYFLAPKNSRAMALSILMGLFNYLNTGL